MASEARKHSVETSDEPKPSLSGPHAADEKVSTPTSGADGRSFPEVATGVQDAAGTPTREAEVAAAGEEVAGKAQVTASTAAVIAAKAQTEAPQAKTTVVKAVEVATQAAEAVTQASPRARPAAEAGVAATAAIEVSTAHSASAMDMLRMTSGDGITTDRGTAPPSQAAAVHGEIKTAFKASELDTPVNGPRPNSDEEEDAERVQDEGQQDDEHEHEHKHEQEKEEGKENREDKQHTHGDPAEEHQHDHDHDHDHNHDHDHDHGHGHGHDHGHDHSHEKEKEEQEGNHDDKQLTLGKRKIESESQPSQVGSGSAGVRRPDSAKSHAKEPAIRQRKSSGSTGVGSAGGGKAAASGKATPADEKCPIGKLDCPLMDCTRPMFGILGGTKGGLTKEHGGHGALRDVVEDSDEVEEDPISKTRGSPMAQLLLLEDKM